MVIEKERLEYGALLAEIIAALGVIISVVYLAIQVGGSTNELRAQTHYNTNIMMNRALELLVGDESLAKIVINGSNDPKVLSAPEWERYTYYHLMAFNAWEYSYYLNESDSIPSELWSGLDARMRNQVDTRPGLQKFWAESQLAYAEPFHTYLGSLFRK